MASKRRNMFYENKKQETTEIGVRAEVRRRSRVPVMGGRVGTGGAGAGDDSGEGSVSGGGTEAAAAPRVPPSLHCYTQRASASPPSPHHHHSEYHAPLMLPFVGHRTWKVEGRPLAEKLLAERSKKAAVSPFLRCPNFWEVEEAVGLMTLPPTGFQSN
ncbi:hypothetical protein AAG570_011129 [Ranatra chinensis]|uniref:Uncharacterized protein n=1 Tax=Ranatra chinensis TaxID=642074 RepID=A0ABD0YY27_9HEMI